MDDLPPAKQAGPTQPPVLYRAPVTGVPINDANDMIPKARDVLAPISFMFLVMLLMTAGIVAT